MNNEIHSVIYGIEAVDNKNRKFGASTVYYPVWIQTIDGKWVPALFTSKAIEDAIKRGENNPEDIPPRSESTPTRFWRWLVGN